MHGEAEHRDAQPESRALNTGSMKDTVESHVQPSSSSALRELRESKQAAQKPQKATEANEILRALVDPSLTLLCTQVPGAVLLSSPLAAKSLWTKTKPNHRIWQSSKWAQPTHSTCTLCSGWSPVQPHTHCTGEQWETGHPIPSPYPGQLSLTSLNCWKAIPGLFLLFPWSLRSVQEVPWLWGQLPCSSVLSVSDL